MCNQDLLSEYFLAPGEGDMTAAIEEKLQRHGVCLLGGGTYTVHGIRMPEGSTLKGMGRATRVLLDPALEEGFAIGMDAFCTVSELFVSGAQGVIELPLLGKRHGILYKGTATRKEWMGEGLKLNSVVQGCFISGFTGGGITCSDTGYYLRAALYASNCHIVNCGAGINIAYLSDYNSFTNVMCAENLYGCINNGGNNMFSSCGFNGNLKTGFLIDNSQNQSPNNSHGSCMGCTFNHNGNNEGIGVEIYGAVSGFVFSGCQMFFSKIVLEHSVGITFTGMNFGRKVDLLVKGGSTMLTSCVFLAGLEQISLSEGAVLRTRDCVLRDGSELVIEA